MLIHLDSYGRRLANWVRVRSPWTNVYGLARTVLALGSIATLLCSDPSTLFRPMVGSPEFPSCGSDMQAVGLYCAVGNLELARWLAIAALLVVASGWRPRITGLVHFYVAYSYHANASILDGGDSVLQIITLLLVPITLTDPRRWHWEHYDAPATSDLQVYVRVLAFFFVALIKVQVAGIYFHAAVGKFAVEQWTNGTALYYWLEHPLFGAPEYLRGITGPLLRSGTFLALATWSVLALEHLLGVALLLSRRWQRALLAGGIAMHLGILVLQGIASFSVTMIASLVLYLRPWSIPLRLPAHVPALWRVLPHLAIPTTEQRQGQ